MFCKAIRRNTTPFVWTLYHSTLRWAISRNATLFVCTLYHSTLRWAISRNATPFVRTLCYSTLPWAISSNATPFGMCAVLFDIALSHFTLRYTVCVYNVPFDITLSHLTQRYTVFVLYCKWVLSYSQFHVCSNLTWATRPFFIWLNYSCLGCSVSWRKNKPSIIWPCHSFIIYAILQPILRPALYLLIYLMSLYFWWWRPPISRPYS